jgi:hypothetical protein
MALKIEEVIDALKQENIPAQTLVSIETKLEELEKEKKEDRASNSGGVKSKNEFVIVVRGDEELKKTLQQGWVVQVKQGDDIQTLPSRFASAAKEHNAKQKRKKNPISIWRDFFQYCKRPFVKNLGVNIKTKEPVQVVVLEKEEI